MNIPLLVFLSAVMAQSADAAAPTLYRPAAAFESAVSGRAEGEFTVRGQSPYGSEPLYTPDVQGGTTTLYPPTYAPDGSAYQPYDPAAGTAGPYYGGGPYSGAPLTSDPFANGGVMPYAAPIPPQQGFYTYGANGSQPYRMGLSERLSIAYLPASGTSPNRGDLEIFEFDFEKAFVTSAFNNWVFTASSQVNVRTYEGPRGNVGPANLPGSVFRLGLNLELATPQVNGWSAELGFNPSVATDFEAGFDRDAILLDFYGVVFWQWNPQWTWAFGALYWDRVDDIILPYAGVVYLPNQYWELRLVFPNPRISYFLGTPYGVATWVYVGAEYHVEAYYIDLHVANGDTRVQYTDWRLYGGMRFEAGQFTTFFEGGVALARDVEFERVGANFDVDSGFFGRVGLKW